VVFAVLRAFIFGAIAAFLGSSSGSQLWKALRDRAEWPGPWLPQYSTSHTVSARVTRHSKHKPSGGSCGYHHTVPSSASTPSHFIVQNKRHNAGGTALTVTSLYSPVMALYCGDSTVTTVTLQKSLGHQSTVQYSNT